MTISDLADSAGDYLGQTNDLLKSGRQAYDTITGKTTPPQTAKDVAAAAPVKQPFNWTPVIIIAGVILTGGLLWLALRD